MANPLLESKTNTAFSLTDSITITKPSGTVENDVLVAFVTFNEAGNETFDVVPSGWTATTDYTGNDGFGIFYKVAGDSEPSNYTWETTGTVYLGGSMYRISGAAVGAEIAGVDITYEGSPANLVMSETVSVTPDSGESLALIAFSAGKDTTANAGYTGVASYTSTPSETWSEEDELLFFSDGDNAAVFLAVASADVDGTTEITNIGATASSANITDFDEYFAAIVVVNAPQDATGNSTLMEVSPNFFTEDSVSVETSANATLLEVSPNLPASSGVAYEPTQWTTTTKS